MCDTTGNVVDDCLSGGVTAGKLMAARYHTVVYYHDGKPRWNEVTKLLSA